MNLNTSFSRVSILVSLSALFSIVGAYIPFLSFLNLFVGGIFLVIGLFSATVSISVIAILAFFLLCFMFLGFLGAVQGLFTFALPGIVMGYLMQKFDDDTPFFAGIVVNCIGFFVMLNILKYISGADFITTYEQALNESVAMLKNMNMQGAVTNEFSVTRLIQSMKYYFPAIIIIISIVQAAFTKYIGLFLNSKINSQNKVKSISFTSFNIPEGTGISLLVLALFLYALSFLNLITKDYADRLVLNVFYVTMGLLLIQGLAVLFYVIGTLKGYKRTIAVVGVAVFFVYIVSALPILGILDLFLDMRGNRFRRSK
ncbi:DUF2232 domain-containing protein [Criibacterium bergeronii]|uniref:DUF2232 domain-containing protein n=1 Tax=Criibacterium bergeronii TaxID=1871336 RepID=A0A552V4P9_9FIRM|nr:DUF2232 domain-containing protein [Criibacterium bergeronii]TRW25428.1 DUF2232 domain-containing protein [Criibacterium bergeronii]